MKRKLQLDRPMSRTVARAGEEEEEEEEEEGEGHGITSAEP